MAFVRLFSAGLLLALVATAYFVLARQAELNGTFTIPFIAQYNERILQGTKIPIKLPQTGIASIDNYFAFMMQFFWVAIDASNVRARLQAQYLLGTLTGAWVLMLTEAHRGVSSGTFLGLTYVFELFGELIGIGLLTPLWCILHLSMTSNPAKTKQNVEESLAINKGSATALGYALLFGHVGPTILMSRTEPDGEGLLSQQFWTIARLFHPVFVLGLWKFFKLFQGTKAGDTPLERRISSARKFYWFSTMASAFGHVSTLAILLAQYWVPNYLRADILAALDLKTIVIPTPFWTEGPVKLVPFKVGVATFLQWDNICAASAIFIWASTLYVEAVLPNLSRVKISGVFNTIVQGTSVTLLAGPVAAAAYLLQERDSVARSYSSQKSVEQARGRK